MMMVVQGCSAKNDDAKSHQKPQPSKISLQCDPMDAEKVTDEQLAMYGEQLPHYFYGNDLCRCVSALLETGIVPEELSKYLTDKQRMWTVDDVYPLAKAGITHEQAGKYNTRLRGQEHPA